MDKLELYTYFNSKDRLMILLETKDAVHELLEIADAFTARAVCAKVLDYEAYNPDKVVVVIKKSLDLLERFAHITSVKSEDTGETKIYYDRLM